MVLSNKKKISRLGVFVFFDKEAIVDDYVLFMLDSLKDAVDDIIIVSNSYLVESEMAKISKYTDEINIRDNYGLDAAAFKYVYEKYGREYFNQYDEVILLNDTFYGPFEPFKKIISKMEDRDVDFWGLTANYDSVDGYDVMKDGYIHSHIQTFFVAFRNNVISSAAFYDYWNNYDIKNMASFEDVVTKHELVFTNYLENKGFKWDTYVDLNYFKSEDRKKNYNIYAYSAYNLIKNYACPFIKRKNFVFNKDDALYINNGMDTMNSLKYIKENNLYDVDLILKNLIRLYDPIDIYYGLNLNFINKGFSGNKEKYLIYVYVSDVKAFNLLETYINKIKNHDVVVVSNDMEVSNLNKKIVFADPVSYLLKNRKKWLKKYKYICLANIKRTFDNKIIEIDDSNIIKFLENSINNDNYINGVGKLFEENKYIGALYLPVSFHNGYFSDMGGYTWNKNIKMLKENSYNVDLNKDKFIDHNNIGIWIDSEALNNVQNFSLSFGELIEVLPYTLKMNNKCIGKLYNEDYIANDTVCMEKIIFKMLGSVQKKITYPNTSRNVYIKEAYLRGLARRILPKSFRKKVVDIFKNK